MKVQGVQNFSGEMLIRLRVDGDPILDKNLLRDPWKSKIKNTKYNRK